VWTVVEDQDLTTLFSIASPTGADTRATVAAVVTGRFSQGARRLATLGRASCTMVLREDMHDGTPLTDMVVRNPFVGERRPRDLEALPRA
jgi:hypothetical protein